ncbi:hypothetical protein IGI04_036660 [Brassica rapa subsp. trilocularis]|uniref:Uncharacterized protein n=1 Tax=Brassica rapa subsp. trilocularis TaxID=1813537 RepID=A0ABQ7LGW6_BRACM|nr:hypothetical protein IGI04_036660 [Brassica rapa subsp. trilocularis]
MHIPEHGEKRPCCSEPTLVGLSAGVGAVVLLVQETHKEGHHLSHEETGGPKTLELKANGDPVGLSADVGIVVLLEDGELVGLSADVGIVVLPVQNSLKLTFKLVTILMSHFLIEDQQEVGKLKEDLSDQSEEAVTPHCSYQPDARIIQSGTFLAKQSHDGGKLWSFKVPLHVETSREQCKGWLREGMAWRIQVLCTPHQHSRN